jgi:biofilm protein TabA
MIFDTLDRAGLYIDCCEHLAEAVAALRTLNAEASEGRTDLNGGAYIALSRYATKLPAEHTAGYEAHRAFIDVQIVLDGQERIEVADTHSLVPREAYDADRDVAFYEPPRYSTSVLLRPGQFVVLFPGDAHRPGLALDEPAGLVKAVAKLPLA